VGLLPLRDAATSKVNLTLFDLRSVVQSRRDIAVVWDLSAAVVRPLGLRVTHQTGPLHRAQLRLSANDAERLGLGRRLGLIVETRGMVEVEPDAILVGKADGAIMAAIRRTIARSSVADRLEAGHVAQSSLFADAFGLPERCL
jgi:hypothetical protein